MATLPTQKPAPEAPPVGNISTETDPLLAPYAGILDEDNDGHTPDLPPDPYLVDFDRTGDPDNPLEWPTAYKWSIVLIITLLAFAVTFTCVAVVPVANRIVRDLSPPGSPDDNDDATARKSSSVLLVTIWELGEAAGPLVIAPLSEAYGRRPVLAGATVLLAGASCVAAASPSVGVLVTARFLTGLSVASNVLGPAVIGDLFVPDQRGAALSLVMVSPLIGGAIGPVLAAALVERAGWRLVLWICAALAAACAVALVVGFRETYRVTLLQRRAQELRESTGDPRWHSAYDGAGSEAKGEEKEGSRSTVWEAVLRPFVVWADSGVLQAMSLYGGVAFTFFYILSTTLPDIMEEVYHLSPTLVGLSFLAFSAGSIVSVVLCNRLLDSIYLLLQARHPQRQGQPEYRLPLVLIGAITLPLMVLGYGWNAGLAGPLSLQLVTVGLMGATMMFGFLPVMTYVVDAFGLYSASAMTALIVTRCLMGAFLPLITAPLVALWGYGGAFTALAVGSWCLAPIPILVLMFGAKWRQISRYTREEI